MMLTQLSTKLELEAELENKIIMINTLYYCYIMVSQTVPTSQLFEFLCRINRVRGGQHCTVRLTFITKVGITKGGEIMSLIYFPRGRILA